MRKLVALGLALLLAGATYAATVVLIKKPGGAAPADVLFWLNFEAGATSGNYTMSTGAGEFSAGDTSGIDNSAFEVSATAAGLGGFGASAPTTGDLMNWHPSAAGDIVSETSGRIGFRIVVNTWPTASSRIFRVGTDATNEFYVVFDSDDGVSACWEATGTGTDCTAIASATGMVVNLWYYIELIYDVATPTLQIKATCLETGTNCPSVGSVVVNVSTSQALNAQNFVTGAGTSCNAGETCLQIGNVSSQTAWAMYIDQIVISNDKTRDMYADFSGLTDYPD